MRVTDRRAAAALSDPLLRRLVLGFTGRAVSVGEVADSSGIELKRLHHYVTRLCRVGLLAVVGERPRRGRAVKLYRAVADSFLIPFEAAPELFTEGLARELRECIRSHHLRSGEGVLLTTDQQGLPSMRLLSESSSPSGPTELWKILRLEPAEAEALRRDLRHVLDRHAAEASGRGKPHLVHAAVARRATATVSVDNRRR